MKYEGEIGYGDIHFSHFLKRGNKKVNGKVRCTYKLGNVAINKQSFPLCILFCETSTSTSTNLSLWKLYRTELSIIFWRILYVKTLLIRPIKFKKGIGLFNQPYYAFWNALG